MRNKLLFLNQFYLKIIALLLMTIDHIGVFLLLYAQENALMNNVGSIFRIVGRLAFPLFILMLVEGINHSKNTKLYLLRIGILTSVLMIAQIIIYYLIDSSIQYAYSPLIDLSLSAITLYLLKRKDKFSFLAILPIAYVIFITAIQYIELSQDITVSFVPFYLRAGYSLLGLALAISFFYSKDIAKLLTSKFAIDGDENEYVQFISNCLCSLFLIVINIIIYCLAIYPNLDIYGASVQTWSMFAAIFILVYNGRRGYNKKWFQYGSYLYFPLHIVIIFLIFFLIYR